MGLCNSPDVFQEMNELFIGMKVRAYIDDLLLITSGTYEEHLAKLEVLLRLREAGLK
jgi:hypothetical protein